MPDTSTQTATKFLNFINGEWVPAKSGEFFEDRNPAHQDQVIGLFPKGGKADVEAAVASARSAFDAWRRTPAPVRGEIMKRVGDLLLERKDAIARDMTREMGKVLAETRGDVQEGIDTAYYAMGEGRRLFGETVPSELPNKFAMVVREPLGVAGIITPWNFPLAIPTWKIFPALLAGNTIVFKPASDVPLTANHFVEALIDGGVPPQAVNLVHGGGAEVGNAIVEHRDVPVVSFTGSTAVGRGLAERCGRSLKRLSLELGGKNAQIVMDDADLDLALEGALWGAFGTTGQRCTATSRLILHEAIHDRLVDRLVERASRLVLGDGLEPKTQVGPLVNAKQLETVAQCVDIGKKEGARLACGGEAPAGGALAEGWFFKPTVFVGVTPAMRIAREEIFGPVLSVLKVKDLDEAIAVLNDTDYGLSSSLYTRDVNGAFRAMRDIHAGITYINGPTIGAEAHLPFGGVKETGNGHREGGWTAYEIFTELKTIYVDYSGRLQRAQIDNR